MTARCHPPPRTPPSRSPTCPGSTGYYPVPPKETTVSDPNATLLKANLRQLKLPTRLAEWEKLAREAAAPYTAAARSALVGGQSSAANPGGVSDAAGRGRRLAKGDFGNTGRASAAGSRGPPGPG